MKVFKIGLLVLLGLLILSLVVFKQNQPTTKIYQAKSAAVGEIEVEVKPERLGVKETENIFAVKFDTHTVDLNFNFTKIISLEDDLGNRYQAVRWEGGRGSHHLEGKIIFSPIKRGTKKVTLKISPMVETRNFAWELL